MTQEEKAKAYDEALKKARFYHGNCPSEPERKKLEGMFPVLRDSDDERARKWLLDYAIEMIAGLESDISLSNYDGIKGHDPEAEAELAQWQKARAYLEKQKERKQSLSEKIRPIFPAAADFVDSVDDIEKNRAIGILEDYLKWAVSSEEECRYTWKELADAIQLGIDAMKEQKPNIELIQRSWYMEGYHDGEFGKEPKWILKTGEGGPKHELNPRYGQPLAKEQKPAEVDESTKRLNDNWMRQHFDDCKERNTAMINGEPIPTENHSVDIPLAEWSEEDEKKIIFLERLIRYNVPEGQYGWTDGHKGGFVTKLEAISMLKSLRPSWKPSEEQMKALKAAMETYDGFEEYDAMKSLYEQLKEL